MLTYDEFKEAMGWLEKNEFLVTDLLGEVVSIHNWEHAFNLANNGEQKKVFIQM